MAALSTWSHGRVPAFHVLSAAYCILTFAGPPGQLRAIQIGTKTALIAHRGVNRILEYLVAPSMLSSISTAWSEALRIPLLLNVTYNCRDGIHPSPLGYFQMGKS